MSLWGSVPPEALPGLHCPWPELQGTNRAHIFPLPPAPPGDSRQIPSAKASLSHGFPTGVGEGRTRLSLKQGFSDSAVRRGAPRLFLLGTWIRCQQVGVGTVSQSAWAAITKRCRRDGSDKETYCSWFWRPEVHDQGASAAGLRWGLPARLADSRLPAVSAAGGDRALCAPHPLTRAQSQHRVSAPVTSPNHVTIGGLGLQHMDLWGTQTSSPAFLPWSQEVQQQMAPGPHSEKPGPCLAGTPDRGLRHHPRPTSVTAPDHLT